MYLNTVFKYNVFKYCPALNYVWTSINCHSYIRAFYVILTNTRNFTSTIKIFNLFSYEDNRKIQFQFGNE